MLAVGGPRMVLLSEDDVEQVRLDWGKGKAAVVLATSPPSFPIAAPKNGPSTQAAQAPVHVPAPQKPAPAQPKFSGVAVAPKSVLQAPRQAAASPPSQQNQLPTGRRLLRKAFPPIPGPVPVAPVARPSAGGQPVGTHPPPYAPSKFGFTKWNGNGPIFAHPKTPVPQPDNYAGYRLPGFRSNGGKKMMVPSPNRFFQAPPAVAHAQATRKRERVPEDDDRTYPEGLAFVFDTSTLMELEQNDLDALLRDNRIILPNIVVHELDEHNKRRRLGQGTERRAQKAVELRDWIASVLEKPEDSHERRHLRLQRVEEVDEKHYAQKRVQDDEIVACAVFFRDRYAGKNLEVYVATDDKILRIKCASEKLKTANSADLVRWSSRKLSS